MLVVKDLSKSYKKELPVIKDISFSLDINETITIVGPSGCGKTTLLYLLCGLLKPDTGEVLFDNLPVKAPTTITAIILQDYGLLPWKTVIENVTLGLKIRKVPQKIRRKRAISLLETLGLKGKEREYPGQLSGGEQQRVAIARALAVEPKFLLMDEPFSSLDAITREKLQDILLQTWINERIPYIMVTHSVEEAIYLGKKVLVMAGKPAKIVATFENPGFGNTEYRREEKYFEMVKNIKDIMGRSW